MTKKVNCGFKECAYSQVNRQMICDLKDDISDIRKGIDDLKRGQEDLFNHQSNRLPLWATGAIAFLSSLVVGLTVAFLSGVI